MSGIRVLGKGLLDIGKGQKAPPGMGSEWKVFGQVLSGQSLRGKEVARAADFLDISTSEQRVQ